MKNYIYVLGHVANDGGKVQVLGIGFIDKNYNLLYERRG